MPVISTTSKVVSIEPVARIEGHLRIDATVDYVNGRQQVVEAKAGGTLFRGFEKILIGRDPLDAPDITERICGVCSVSQGLTAVLALERAGNLVIPDNARIMRNLIMAADTIHSHILHFYILSLMDFVEGPPMPPWTPSWKTDKRITGGLAAQLVNNYVKALDMRRKAHEMGALFAGRLPHSPAMVPGGFTTTPRQERIDKYRQYAGEILAFVEGAYLSDVQTVANTYADYYALGAGPKNLIAFGVFDLDPTGQNYLLRRGTVTGGAKVPAALNAGAIQESVAASWYAAANEGLNPANGATTPQHPKANAYSWLKAPRYNKLAFEAGPLARMWVNGDYQNGISVMDRHMARALETRKIARELDGWARQLRPSGPVYQTFTPPSTTVSAYGLSEAPRGALGHWVKYSGGKIANYQVISPTCWNASPRDAAGVPGAIEQALVGVPVQNLDEPVEISRVVHSFDPCLACAVHVMRPAGPGKVFTFGPA